MLPIRIVKGEPAIEIVTGKKTGETVIRVPWQRHTAYDKFQIVQERDDLYTIYEKGALHKTLAEIGKPTQQPASGHSGRRSRGA